MPKKPAPFARPGVSLARHGKEWQDVYSRQLSVGDHVLNHGIIKEIKIGNRGLEFVFSNPDLPIHFAEDSKITAFTLGS